MTRPPQEALLPRDSTSLPAGAAVSLAVHAVLLAALAGIVQWRTQSQTVVVAELWSSVPESAAPPAPAPAPPPAPAPAPVPAPAPPPPAAAAPRPPDIATEQERARQLERERLERQERERQAQAERTQRERRERAEREAREATERTEATRQETLRRMMAQAASGAGANPTGTAARDAAPSASYVSKLAALIRSNTVFSGEVPGNPAAEVEVRAGAGGAILSRRLVKSSGHPAWDDAVLRAIDRTARLPPDTDGRVPPTLLIAFRPKE
jgi:colicin import membrane protein